MLMTVLSLLALYGVWRIAKAALGALRSMPRSNEDLIDY